MARKGKGKKKGPKGTSNKGPNGTPPTTPAGEENSDQVQNPIPGPSQQNQPAKDEQQGPQDKPNDGGDQQEREEFPALGQRRKYSSRHGKSASPRVQPTTSAAPQQVPQTSESSAIEQQQQPQEQQHQEQQQRQQPIFAGYGRGTPVKLDPQQSLPSLRQSQQKKSACGESPSQPTQPTNDDALQQMLQTLSISEEESQNPAEELSSEIEVLEAPVMGLSSESFSELPEPTSLEGQASTSSIQPIQQQQQDGDQQQRQQRRTDDQVESRESDSQQDTCSLTPHQVPTTSDSSASEDKKADPKPFLAMNPEDFPSLSGCESSVTQEKSCWGKKKEDPAKTTAIDIQKCAQSPGSSSQSVVTEKGQETPSEASSTEMELPERKNLLKTGTKGKSIQVYTNMMKLEFGEKFNTEIIHCDVSIEKKTPNNLIRDVFDAARGKIRNSKFVGFDGKKNAYHSGKLPFDEKRDVDVIIEKQKFKVTVKYAAQLDLSWLKNVQAGIQLSDDKQKCLQALDIILRTAALSRTTIPIGRSFFTEPKRNETPPCLTQGMDLWTGHFQSAVVGWKPFLNIDVVHKAFPKRRVIDVMKSICDCNDQTELTADLIKTHKKQIDELLRGLKVTYQIPNNAFSKRTNRVNGLADKSAKEHKFKVDNQETTIEKYYLKEKNYEIENPTIPCLWVGNKEREIYIPVELCEIDPGQTKRPNVIATSKIISYASTPTNERKDKIMNACNNIGFKNKPCTKEFGISVSEEFTKIPARVLDCPKLSYRTIDVAVSNGEWGADKFRKSSSDISRDKSWAILAVNSEISETDVTEFTDNLKEAAKKLGFKIGKAYEVPGKIIKVNLSSKDDKTSELDKQFRMLKKNNVKLVVVITPKSQAEYNYVKQVAELRVGILTQCLKHESFITIKNNKNSSITTNLILKINAKLNGINHKLADDSLKKNLPFCLEKTWMIVGADVTHPSPDAAKNTSSYAAVVASYDLKDWFQYRAEIRVQASKQETIEDLAEMMEEHLKFFHKKNNKFPDHIVFYRDGVGEGHFKHVLNVELPAIRKAYSSFTIQSKSRGEKYEPQVTFLVVQKRHHTRFFPDDTKAQVIDKDSCNNVLPGTVVDTEITHPTDIEFYLVSHASQKGTARPAKYRCLRNESDLTEDQLEQLTYYLCHLFTRCTRSVSYPAPTYYAHLAAFRARAWTYGINTTRVSKEQKDVLLKTAGQFQDGNPMFFV